MTRHHVSIIDVFDIKPTYTWSQHEPGTIIMVDGRQCGFDLPPLGSEIELLRPDGEIFQARFTEFKEHGDGRSLFLPGLTRDRVPVGTVASWPASEQQLRSREALKAGTV